MSKLSLKKILLSMFCLFLTQASFVVTNFIFIPLAYWFDNEFSRSYFSSSPGVWVVCFSYLSFLILFLNIFSDSLKGLFEEIKEEEKNGEE